MSMEKEFTNLEQSKWLQTFFEKYPKLKPEHFAWRLDYGGYKDSVLLIILGEKVYESTGAVTEIEPEFLHNIYPAYTLRQLEGLLPTEIDVEINGKMLKAVLYPCYNCGGKLRALCWNYRIGNDGTSEFVSLITYNSFHNIIELLKRLDENGHLKDS